MHTSTCYVKYSEKADRSRQKADGWLPGAGQGSGDLRRKYSEVIGRFESWKVVTMVEVTT